MSDDEKRGVLRNRHGYDGGYDDDDTESFQYSTE